MAKLTTDIFVLCDQAIVSQDQKLSIIGIFDQFFVTDLPSTWPRMFLVAVVRGEPNEEYKITLKLTPPQKTDKDFPDKEFTIKLGQNGKANVMTELVHFPLQVPGTHKIQLTDGKEAIGTLEYKVNKTTATYQGTDSIGKKLAN